MAVGGSKLPPRLPPVVPSAPRSPSSAPAPAPTPARASVPAAPARAAVPDALQPTPARPATPAVSLTSVSPNPGTPSPQNPFVRPTKLSGSSSAGYQHFDTQSTATLEHGTHGLALDVHAAGQGGKVVLAGANTQAQLNYQPSAHVQAGVQALAAGSLATGLATASAGVDPTSGAVAGKLSAGVQGPLAVGLVSQTTQVGSHVKNELSAAGIASAGSANVSTGAQFNPSTGSASVNAGFSAMGPSASVAAGHTTTLGPVTISNTWSAAAGTAGISASVHAGNQQGVLSWGANTQLLAGGGVGWMHSVSIDTNYFKQAPPSTAVDYARQNQGRYGTPPPTSGTPTS